MIAERRRLAFAALGARPLDAFDRVVGDGVLVAEIFEQRRQRREAVPDRAAVELAPREVVAPGDDMRPGHDAEFLRPHDAGEAHEIADRVFVGAPGAAVGDVGEPLDLGRDLGQPVKLGGGQQPLGRGDRGRQLGVGSRVGHVHILFLQSGRNSLRHRGRCPRDVGVRRSRRRPKPCSPRTLPAVSSFEATAAAPWRGARPAIRSRDSRFDRGDCPERRRQRRHARHCRLRRLRAHAHSRLPQSCLRFVPTEQTEINYKVRSIARWRPEGPGCGPCCPRGLLFAGHRPASRIVLPVCLHRIEDPCARTLT